jgi:hypothetical protein
MSTPVLSIVTIARDEEELDEWRQRLSTQTFDDYEVCYSTADGIAKAWNESLAQANGRIVLFTETDTYPIHDDWLETVVERYSEEDNGVVHFGEFRGYNPFNFSNTAVSADLIRQYPIDESYPVGEDSELFARMDKEGVKFEHDLVVPVFHEPKSTDKMVSRAFDYGRVKARSAMAHGRLGPSTNTSHTTHNSNDESRVRFFSERAIQVLMSRMVGLLFFVGFGFEYVAYYLSELRETLRR